MQDGRLEVLDVLRHRFVALTPEEWVRQHFINFLITDKGYPAALLANEVELVVGNKRLRCDSVLYGPDRKPLMVMEYKAESVPITEKVVRQVTTYNMLLHVRYIIISNGLQHLCLYYDNEEGAWHPVSTIPDYEQVTSY